MLQSSYAPVIVLLATSALGAGLPVAVLSALGVATALLGVAVIALKLALH